MHLCAGMCVCVHACEQAEDHLRADLDQVLPCGKDAAAKLVGARNRIPVNVNG